MLPADILPSPRSRSLTKQPQTLVSSAPDGAPADVCLHL